MPVRFSLACVVLIALGASAPAQAASLGDADAQKVIKSLVNAIRYNKDDMAAKNVAFTSMAQFLLADHWSKATPAEQKELAAGLETVIRKVTFPKGREMFEHLDAILYDKVKMDGERARLKTTVVVHRDYKKAEIVIDFILAQDGGSWKVMDTVMLGDSTLGGIREDQVLPLVQKGGLPAVMQALRERVAELQKA